MESIDIEYNEEFEELAKLLSTVRRPGSFVTSGRVDTSPPSLEIRGVGPVAFPILPGPAKEIVGSAERAPYGRGEETLVDPNVRRVWQLTPGQFSLKGRGWKSTLDTIVERAANGLGCEGMSVSAELYKLLVYDEGGFFVSHRDTEKTDGMFATLVIVLPSLHRGGELVVRHADREVSLDLQVPRDEALSQLSFAAFYADCEHEVKRVTRGHRVCLVYNLIGKRSGRGRKLPSAPDYRAETDRASKLLESWAARKDAPPKVVYLLEHQYSPAGLSFSGLKNSDAAFGRVLADAADRAGYAVHLGVVHIEESGGAIVHDGPRAFSRSRSHWGWDSNPDPDFVDADDEDFEVIEAYERVETIDHWVDRQDRAVDFGPFPLAPGELLPAGALDDEPPDVQRVSEATGNEGGSYERAYHRAAIVLWRHDRYPEIVLQAGVAAAVPHLGLLLEGPKTGSDRAASRREFIRFAKRVIREWPIEQDRWDDPAATDSGHRVRMLDLLIAAGDRGLLEEFVARVVVEYFDGTEEESLIAGAPLLSVPAIGKHFARIVEKHFDTAPEACASLLSRLATAPLGNHRARSTLLPALRKIAGAIIDALPEPAADEDSEEHDPSVRLLLARLRPALEPPVITRLFSTLTEFCSKGIVDRAVTRIIAAPDAFPPDTVLTPALAELCREGDFDLRNHPSIIRLWRHTADSLLARSATPPEQPTDWAQPVEIRCRCEDCRALQEFANDPLENVARFRVRKERRRHLHQAIDRHDLDMSRQTERKGSPQTLICTKTRKHHQRRTKQYRDDVQCLGTLADLVEGVPKVRDLLPRVREAIAGSKKAR